MLNVGHNDVCIEHNKQVNISIVIVIVRLFVRYIPRCFCNRI